MMRTLQIIEEAQAKTRESDGHLQILRHIDQMLIERALPVGQDEQLTPAMIERTAYDLHTVAGRIAGESLVLLVEMGPLHQRMEGARAASAAVSTHLKEADECIDLAREASGTPRSAAGGLRLAHVSLHLAAAALSQLHEESGL